MYPASIKLVWVHVNVKLHERRSSRSNIKQYRSQRYEK